MTILQPTNHQRRLLYCSLAVLGVTVGLVGCSGQKLAPVNGTVTYKGGPVKGGTLVFGPVATGKEAPGKPATATVQPDGTFTLGTNSTSDGAVIGRHRVTFTPPQQELTEEQRRDRRYIAPPPAYMGLKPKVEEVEVTAGKNEIRIELVRAQ